MGVYVLGSLDDDRLFTTSPHKYPERRHYDETAIRFGLKLGTGILIDRELKISFFVIILDDGITAIVKNYQDIEYRYLLSSGLSLKYLFQ